MNKYKKLVAGLTLGLAVLVAGLVLLPQKASAASQDDVKKCVDSLRFIDIAHLVCESPAGTVIFNDNNPTDNGSDDNEGKTKINYEADSSVFCRNSSSVHIAMGRTSNFKIGDAGKDQLYRIYIGYADSNNNCVDGLSVQTIPGFRTDGIYNLLQFTSNGNNIESLDGVEHGSLNGQSYSVLEGDPGSGYYFVSDDFDVSGDSCNGSLIAVNVGRGSSRSIDTTAIGRKINFAKNKPAGDFLGFLKKQGNTGGCGVGSIGYGLGDEGGFGLIGTPPSEKVTNPGGGVGKGDPCDSGKDCKDGVCQKANGDCTINKAETCESNFDKPFTWFICPMLDMADGAAGAFYGFIEKELCFKTGSASETGGVVCEGKSYLEGPKNKIKTSWSIFKNIATGVLIVILLIAIIAQALGIESGPLNTYTIRKLLPRIVIAVIFIQLSWYLLKYAIDLSNDAGYAIKDLLMAPFGGPNNLDLTTIVGNGVEVATGGGAGANTFALFLAIAAIPIFYYMIPALPLLALYVILALLVAFLTLIIRKILIVILVILAPLAVIAWILPGTENYWKMWRDNFPKLLLMFPMIAALIASGQIVAYLAAPGSTGILAPAITHIGSVPLPNFGAISNFAQLAIVVAAWFAPFFLLPKTFSWGGSLMKATGETIMKGTARASKRPREGLKNVEQGWREQRRRDSQERVRRGEGFNKLAPWRLPIDRFRSGAWNPFYGVGPTRIPGTDKVYGGSRRRARAIAGYVEQGEKARAEDLAAAEAKVIGERQEHRAKGGQHDNFLQAIASGRRSFYDKNLHNRRVQDATNAGADAAAIAAMKRDKSLGQVELGTRSKTERDAARRQLAKLGAGMNWRYLEDYYEHTTKHGTEKEKAEMRKFFDDNVDTILPKLPHIYKSIGQAADADPGTIAGMHGVEVEAILSHLTDQVNTAATPQARQSAQGQITKFLHNFNRAVENSERGGPQLENGALRAVKAYMTSDEGLARQILEDDDTGINAELLNGRRGEGRKEAGLDDRDRRTLLELGRSDALTFDTTNDAEQAALTDLNGLRDTLDAKINEAGYVKATNGAAGAAAGGVATTGAGVTTTARGAPAAPGVVFRPGEIRIQHEAEAARTLPPPATVAAGPQREALKLQLRTDPNAAQVLANNIAYGNAGSEYFDVLAEMRNQASAPGATPDLKDSYNSIISQVQQALQRRINETAGATQARGRDASTAYTAASNRLTPQIVNLEADAPQPPPGVTDLRKLS
jgi:hypothetical protein